MAYTSHSIANPTYKTVRKTFSRSVDLFGNPLKTSKIKFYQQDWPMITSSSKVGDFKLQDHLRVDGESSAMKKNYYSASKMTFAQAETKAALAYTSRSVSHSIASNGGFMSRNYIYARTSLSSTCAATIAQSVDAGNAHIVATSKDTSAGQWSLQRAVMGFDLQKAAADAHYTKVVLKIYTGLGACTKTNVVGHTVKPVRWTGGPTVTDADFNDFDTNYQSTTATNVTASGDADEYNEIVIDGTLLDWMNSNPQGDINNDFFIMLRGAYDYLEDGVDGIDPTGINQLIFIPNTEDALAANKQPELYAEWTSSAVVNKIGNLKDGSGNVLSATASVSIGGVHSSSIGGHDKSGDGIWKVNHNPKDKYANNFLAGTGESEWQFCFSASHNAKAVDGVDTNLEDHQTELTLVGKNTGINFKVKKSSVDFLGNVLNFKKKN